MEIPVGSFMYILGVDWMGGRTGFSENAGLYQNKYNFFKEK